MTPAWGEITVAELAAVCGGTVARGDASHPVSGVSTDSRTLEPGDLFVALSGPRFDGHSFAGRALSAGAAGVIAGLERAASIEGDGTVVAVDDPLAALGRIARWWRGLHDVRVAAVTGSAGKTTTKEMAALVIASLGPTLKTKGNLNNLIGVPLTLLRIRPEHTFAVIEMGMNRPGEIAALTDMAEPDFGLITNVGRAHLEGLGSIEGVARAKWELAEGLRPEAVLVINGDDDELMKLAGESAMDVITFGTGARNVFRALDVEDFGIRGVRFRISFAGGSAPVRLRAPGIHHVMNALAAAALGVTAGARLDGAASALERFSPLTGRFMVRGLPGGVTLVDDTYNANPSSLKAALRSASGLVEKNGRLLVGLGPMGELGPGAGEAHREAGLLVTASGAARLWAMGLHASKMIDGAVRGGMAPDRAEISESHGRMASSIRDAVRAGDVVFLKGSRSAGMERVVEILAGTGASEDTPPLNRQPAGTMPDEAQKHAL